MPLYRAYTLLEIKSVDPVRRLIRGTASTPRLDRQKHIIEPAGATFAPTIPLLLHHRPETPVGVARLRREAHAITFEAELPIIDEPGPVKDEVDRAWTSVTSKPPLIDGVSIGWRPLTLDEHSIEFRKDGSTRFLQSEICEISLVSIPANPDALIAANLVLDAEYRAAAGLPSSPGDSGQPVERPPQRPLFRMTTDTITETIRSYETSLAAKQAQIDAILNGAREQQLTLDASQRESCDTLQTECDGIIDTINRFRAREKSLVATATPVPVTANGRPAQKVAPISVKANVMPGGLFTRATMARVICRGNNLEAAQYAADRWPETPEVSLYLKAAVAAGTTTDANWAKPLTGITADFIELLRPKTAIGQMVDRLRRVPWNTPVPAQTGTGTYNWVGEGKPKPVTSLAFSSATLPITKAAGIIVITEELARTSSPAAEETCRNDMIAGITKFIDQQFLDPAVAAVTGVHPASVTNGVTPITSVGPLHDIVAIASAFTAANVPLTGLTFVMSPNNALVLSFSRDASSNPTFPNVGIDGGSVNGLSVVTSAQAGTNVIGIIPPLVLFNDEGGITVDVSREASLQMSDAPADPADATTVYTSLWQNNYVGLRAEWFIGWLKANANAVKYVNGATYTVPTAGPMMASASAPPEKNHKRGE